MHFYKKLRLTELSKPQKNYNKLRINLTVKEVLDFSPSMPTFFDFC